MHDSNAEGNKSIQEVDKLRRRVAKLEQVNRKLVNSKTIHGEMDKALDEWEITFNSTKDSIMVIDSNYKIIRANLATLRLLEKPLENIVGKTCWQVVYETEKPPEECPLKKALSSKNHEEAELYVSDKDIWLQIAADPILDEKNNIEKIVHIMRDITKHKQAEFTLIDSEEKFRTIFKSANDGIIYIDSSGVILNANERAVQMFGGPRTELLNKHVTELGIFTAEGIPPVANCFEDILAGRQAILTVPIKNKQGREIILECSAFLTRIECQRGNILIIARDITDRMKIEQSVKKERDRAQKYLDIAGVMLVAVDTEQRVGLINKKGREILEYSEDEIIGKNWFDNFLPERIRGEVKVVFEELVAGQADAPEYYENPILTKNGQERLIAWYNTVLKDEKGNVLATLSSGEDITERKKAQEALRESEEKFRLLAEQGFDIVLGADPTGTLTYVSPSVTRVLGYDPDEMVGNNAIEFTPETSIPNVKEQFQLVAEGKTFEGREVEVIHKDGSTITVELNSAPIYKDGQLVGAQASMRDITDRKNAEEKLHQEFRMRDTLLDNLPCVAMILKKGTREIVASNEAARKIGAVPGETCYGMSAEREDPCPFCLAPDVWKMEESRRLEVEYRGKHYEGIWVPLTEDLYVHYIFDISDRKNALEALQESEEKYRQIVSTTTDAIILFDAETRQLVDANEACLELYGHSREEFLKLRQSDITAEPEKTEDSIIKTLNGKARRIPVRYHKKKDGTIFPVEISDSSFVHEGHSVLCGIVRDITERKKAEETLRESEQKYRMFVQDFHGIAYQGDINFRPFFFHGDVKQITGYSEKEFLSGKPRWDQVIHQDDVLNIYKEAKKMHTIENYSLDLEYRIVRKDGKVRWVNEIIQNIKDDTGKPVKVQGVIYDITERKKAEESLLLRERAIDASIQGISITDPKQLDNPVVYVNYGFERMTGYKKSEIIGKNMRFLKGPSTDKENLSELKDAIDNGRDCTVELLNYRKDGSLFWNRIALTPVRDEAGKLTHFIAIHTDVTSNKEAEEKLHEHQAKLKAMASEILRTEERERKRIATGIHDHICQKLVLTKITLESSLQLIPDSNVSKSIKVACESIGKTIEQADSLTFELSNPLLRELGFVLALKKYLKEEIQNKHGISFELEYEEQLNIKKEEIKNSLFRISRELLTNIVKHAQASNVKVSVHKSRSQIRIVIQDDGVGFDSNKVSSEVFKTNRFGLFSIQEQLEQMRGTFAIESEPGLGTTATLVVPLREDTLG